MVLFSANRERPFRRVGAGRGLSGKVALNEDTLWSGFPRYSGVDNAAELRKSIIKEHNYYKAEEIAERMQGPFSESYLPLGTLCVSLEHRGTAANYRRALDMRSGVCPRHVEPAYLENWNKVTGNPIVYDVEWERSKEMRSECHLQVVSETGVVRCGQDGFSIKESDEVVLLQWAGTSFTSFEKDSSDNDIDLEGSTNKILAGAAAFPFYG